MNILIITIKSLKLHLTYIYYELHIHPIIVTKHKMYIF